jgi:hypothetical protein
MRVKIFSDFCDPCGNLGALKSWGKGTQYENLEFVCSDDFSHAVVINSATLDLKIPSQNILNLLWEPYELLDLRKISSFTKGKNGIFIAHDERILGNNVKYWIPFLPPLPLNENYIKPKTRRMSIVASSKAYLPGHKLRHKIVQRILATDLDIDIFGTGITDIFRSNDKRIKGRIEDKSLAFSGYDYTIAIENTKYDYYLTEKYTDPIICGCVPLYWGARKVNTVYGNESHIDLPETNDPDVIFEAIEKIYYGGLKKDTNVVFERIKKEINFPHFVWQQFNL